MSRPIATPAASAMPMRAAATGAREDRPPAARSASQPMRLRAHGSVVALARAVRGGLAHGSREPAERAVAIERRRRPALWRAAGAEVADGRGPSRRRPSSLDLVGDGCLEERLGGDRAVAQRATPARSAPPLWRTALCAVRTASTASCSRCGASAVPIASSSPATASYARATASSSGRVRHVIAPAIDTSHANAAPPATHSTRSPAGDGGMPVASR